MRIEHTNRINSFWIAYAVEEGAAFSFLRCNSEEHADDIIHLYLEAGIMENPYAHLTANADLFISPVCVMKFEEKDYLVKLPEENE